MIALLGYRVGDVDRNPISRYRDIGISGYRDIGLSAYWLIGSVILTATRYPDIGILGYQEREGVDPKKESPPAPAQKLSSFIGLSGSSGW